MGKVIKLPLKPRKAEPDEKALQMEAFVRQIGQEAMEQMGYPPETDESDSTTGKE